jgi:hypothetical protein
MSLNFQLARGGLALLALASLAAVALFAPTQAEPTRIILVTDAAPAATVACPLPPPSLRLALAPTDLPALPRSMGACRA